MSKKAFAVLFSFFLLLLFVSIGYGQSSKKTITLPNGDVVCDLNGEWDALYQPYGPWSYNEDGTGILKITQKGAIFVGVNQGKAYPKGKEGLRGELTKGGFKNVQIWTNSEGYLDCTCEICEDGKEIIVGDGEKVKVTLTRR